MNFWNHIIHCFNSGSAGQGNLMKKEWRAGFQRADQALLVYPFEMAAIKADFSFSMSKEYKAFVVL